MKTLTESSTGQPEYRWFSDTTYGATAICWKPLYREDSPKKDYIKQMTVWLGWQEAVGHFCAYLNYTAIQTNIPSDSHQLHSDSESELEDELDDNDLNEPTVLVFPSTPTSHSIAVKPAYPHIGLSTITTDFKATGFFTTLTTYIQRAYPPPALPLFPTAANRFDVYKQVNVPHHTLPTVGQQAFVDHIQATPAVSGCGCLSNVPAHFDMVLIRVPEDKRVTKQQKGLFWKVCLTLYSSL